MAQRYFNWKLAIVLVVALVVLAAAAISLRQWHKSTRAEQALPAGEQAYEAGRWEEAASHLGRYLVVNSNDVRVLLMYADAQLNQRPLSASNVMQAETAYRAILRLEPDNVEAVERLVELYAQMKGSLGDAELVASRYLEQQNDPNVRRLLARVMIWDGRFSEAAAELDRVIEEYPDQVDAYEQLALIAEGRPGDVNQPSSFWLGQAVAQNPNSALAYAARANAHWRRGDPNQALADLDRAEKQDLTDSDVRLRVARELMNLDQLDRAREHLKVLQSQRPTEFAVWRISAQLALRAASPEEMEEVADGGLAALGADRWDFLPLAAELFIRSGQHERAKDCLAQMRQKDLLPAHVAYLEGMLAEREGRLRDAIRHWREAISLKFPDPLGEPSPVPHVLVASAYTRLGDLQSAINELREAVADYPSDLPSRLTLARLLVDARNWPAALEQARQVKELDPNHPEARMLEMQSLARLLAVADPNLAEVKQGRRDLESRLKDLEAMGEDPSQIELLRAQLAVAEGRFAEAESLLRRLEAEGDQKVAAALLRAQLQREQGKEDEAIATLRDAVDQFPAAVEPVRRLAFLLDRLGRRQESQTVVRDAMDRVEDRQARKELGLLLADLYRRWEQDDQLHDWLTTLAEQFPEDIRCRRQLLMLDRVIEDQDRAQKIVDQIKSLEGEDGWQWRYEQAKVWYMAERAVPEEQRDALQSERFSRITKLLEQNLLTNENDQASRMLLAATCEKAGATRLALNAYREALARSPYSVQVLTQVVGALYRANELEEAGRVLREAQQRGLDGPELQRLQLQVQLPVHLQRGEFTSASGILRDFISRDAENVPANLTLALLQMRQDKFEEASALLKDLRAKNPDNLSVVATCIQLALERDNRAEAVRIADDTVERLGDASAYLLRGRVHGTLGDPNKALSDYALAIATDPERADLRVTRAEFYRSLGRMEEAVADARKAITQAQDNPTIQHRAILLLLTSTQRSWVEEGRAALDKALSTHPNDPQLRFLHARVQAGTGTAPGLEEARRTLREVTDEHPGLADAWEFLGNMELQRGQPDRAADIAMRGLTYRPDSKALLLLKARAERQQSPLLAVPTLRGLVEQYPEDIEILIQLVLAYIEAERPQRAIELLRARVPQLQDEDARYRCELALATALYEAGQRQEAKQLFEAAMEARPDDAAPVLAQADLLSKDGRWAELNQLVEGWRAAHPDDIEALTSIGRVLANKPDRQSRETAENLLRVTLIHDPNALPALMVLGMLMQREERHEEAAERNERILELDPNNLVALNNLAWVRCENQDRPQDALRLADRGVRVNPNYADLLDTRGVIHHRLGNLEKAAADLTRCLELMGADDPASAQAHFHLARVYLEMGRRNDALNELKQALEFHEQAAEVDRDIGRLPEAELEEANVLQEKLKGSSG